MIHLAVIHTGGKQYVVSPGDKLKIAKLEGAEGSAVIFSDVFLTSNGEKTAIGTPTILDAQVEATILKQARTRKMIISKYHNKTRYRKRQGHRQHYTEVEIGKIVV
ncbi:MAG: 50S ribosomal protein L21 [bacterium]|nr:50S ribosomal protein L21 [bacterium]